MLQYKFINVKAFIDKYIPVVVKVSVNCMSVVVPGMAQKR